MNKPKKNPPSRRALKKTYYAMLLVFMLLLTFFISGDKSRALFAVYAALSMIFLGLGIALIVLALKSQESRLMKVFLILMGGSAGGILVGAVLHNLFYAFAVMSEGIVVLVYLFEFIHVTFFLLSIIGCPLAFIVGAVGAMVLWKKNKR